MDVNWRWHSRYRGLLPLSPHAVADDGGLLFARPDELHTRQYQVFEVRDGIVTEHETLVVETVRQLPLTPHAPIRIGVTDDNLYLFREGRKSRFMAERRVSYLSVALAREGAAINSASAAWQSRQSNSWWQPM